MWNLVTGELDNVVCKSATILSVPPYINYLSQDTNIPTFEWLPIGTCYFYYVSYLEFHGSSGSKCFNKST